MQHRGSMDHNANYNHVIQILISDNVPDSVFAEKDTPLFSFVKQYMVGCEHVNFHTEGDVWAHTSLVIKYVMEEDHDYLDVAAALLHDIGKKDALAKNDGCNMHGHEILGIEPARAVLQSFGFGRNEIDIVLWVIRHHTEANDLVHSKSKYNVWKLVHHPWFYRLKRLAVADAKGTICGDGNPIMDYDAEFEKSLAYSLVDKPMPTPIVTWDDLSNIPLEDRFYAYMLCHKIQINGNVTKKTSILSSLKGALKSRSRYEDTIA